MFFSLLVQVSELIAIDLLVVLLSNFDLLFYHVLVLVIIHLFSVNLRLDTLNLLYQLGVRIFGIPLPAIWRNFILQNVPELSLVIFIHFYKHAATVRLASSV